MSNLNIRTGLFRLWIVLAVSWILSLSWLSFESLSARKFQIDYKDWVNQALENRILREMPQGYHAAIGQAQLDILFGDENMCVPLIKERYQLACNSLEWDREAHAIYNKTVRSAPDWPIVLKPMSIILGPPIFLFFLGVTGIWILRGFRSAPPSPEV